MQSPSRPSTSRKVISLHPIREPAADLVMASHPADSDRRHGLETFVRDIYQRHYGAQIRSFYPNLVSVTRPDENIVAVAGVRPAADTALFAEQYLDAAVEQTISTLAATRVQRHSIVEVGNLAPSGIGQARWLIASITAYLNAAGFQWVVFTAVPTLANAFTRMGLQPVALAPADPARIAGDQADDWGTYYDSDPVVYAGNIERGFAHLESMIRPNQPRLLALVHGAATLGTEFARVLDADGQRCQQR